MPGIFDPQQGGGLLSGLFGAMANSSPTGQEMQFRQRAYNALSQQTNPQDAAILMGNPQAYGLAWQRQLFIDQLQSLMGPDPDHPKMPLNEALYRITAPGQAEQYGRVPGTLKAGNAEVPAYTAYPPGTGVGRQPPEMNTIGPGIQPQPSQTPQPQQPQGPALPPQVQQTLGQLQDISAQGEAKSATAKAAGTALPQFPGVYSQAKNTIDAIKQLIQRNDLNQVVGGIQGKIPGNVLIGNRADLVNKINGIQGQVMGQIYTGARSLSGRPISPGAMKELAFGKDLMSARNGTVAEFQQTGRDIIKNIQDEVQAAWVGAGSPKESKPDWGPEETQQPPPAQTWTDPKTKKTYNVIDGKLHY